MKYLIVIPVPGRFENMACLEQAIDLSNANHEVFLLDLSQYALYPRRKKLRCFVLGFTHKNQIQKITKKIAKEHQLTLVSLSGPYARSKKFSFDEELSLIFQKGFASKFSHVTGRSKTYLTDFSEERVCAERRFFLSTYSGVRNIIENLDIQHLISWNGRFLLDSASVLAARKANIPTSLLEVGSAADLNMQLYSISPHSISNRVKLQSEAWKNAGADAEEKAEIGLRMRMVSPHPEGGSWRDDFHQPFQPTELRSRKLAAFFTTTDIEYSTFSDIDEATSFNGKQAEAFLTFCRYAFRLGYEVVVRVHPPGNFSSAISKHEDEIWSKLCIQTGATMLGTNSGVDSVDLMRKSDLNVTYNSSIGVESILLGRPTLILGQTDYSHLVEENCAFTNLEIEEKLLTGVSIPGRDSLYPWGYWYAFGGKKLENFSRNTRGEIYFGNCKVEEIRHWYQFLKKLRQTITGYN
jgi:hypothetical protein